MSKTDAWMPLWIGDYLADTMHLGAAQHGAYLLLLMHAWRRGAPADDDALLARIARMTPEEWAAARPIVAEFFQVEGGFWRHRRLDAELEKALGQRERLAERGRKAARVRHGAEHGASNAQAVLKQGSSPSPSERTPSESSDREERAPVRTDARSAAPLWGDMVLPDWLPPDAWHSWCRHRSALGKKGWTERAAELCLSSLSKLREGGDDPVAVIERSIAGGWTGLFALKRGASPLPLLNGNSTHGHQQQPRAGAAERRTYGSDGVTAKRAVLAAMAGELGCDGDTAGDGAGGGPGCVAGT